MKYISLILFTLALAWTWNLVHHEHDISFETHSGIQEKFAAYIVERIKTSKPNATDIVVEKIWTEVLAANKVKASFIYSFKEPSDQGPILSQIQGETILERQETTADGQDHWMIKEKPKTTSDVIQFEDATIVTGSGAESTAPEAPAETPANSDAQPTKETH